jgi:hypothetical protein
MLNCHTPSPLNAPNSASEHSFLSLVFNGASCCAVQATSLKFTLGASDSSLGAFNSSNSSSSANDLALPGNTSRSSLGGSSGGGALTPTLSASKLRGLSMKERALAKMEFRGSLPGNSKVAGDGLPGLSRQAQLYLPPISNAQRRATADVVAVGGGSMAGAGRMLLRSFTEVPVRDQQVGRLSGAGVAPGVSTAGALAAMGGSLWQREPQLLSKADVKRWVQLVPGGPPVPRVSELAAAARPFPASMLSATSSLGGSNLEQY